MPRAGDPGPGAGGLEFLVPLKATPTKPLVVRVTRLRPVEEWEV